MQQKLRRPHKMDKTIFLSYLRQDAAYAQQLKPILERLGYTVVGFLDLEEGFGPHLTDIARLSLPVVAS